MKKVFLAGLGAMVLMMMGCEKNELPVPLEYDIPAKLKINYASPYAANPLVQLKVNGQRVSSDIRYAYPFPGGGLNTQGGSQPDFLSVPTGNVEISISLPKVGTNTDSVELYKGTVNIPSSGFYSVHISDTATNTKSMVFTETPVAPDSGFSKYRFVNLIPNVPAIDLYFNNVVVAANIPYNGASDYFNIAFPTASSWAIRPAGASPTSTALATYTNTTPNQRVFVVYARGFGGVTDANRRPNVSLYYLR